MSLQFLQSLIGGSPQAGGMLEGAWAVLGRLFASGAASEMIGGLARGGIGNAAYNALDLLTDAYLISGSFPGKSQQHGQHGSESMKILLGEDAERAFRSHGFILQQLSANKHKEGVGEVLRDYQSIRGNLPDEALFKRAYRKLIWLFRADHVAEYNHKTNPLASALNEAKAHLEDKKIVAAYNEVLPEYRAHIERKLEDIAKFDWKAAYEKAERSGQLKLGFNGNMNPLSKAQQWASGLSGGQKAGLAFGAVAAIGLGAYAIAKVVDSRRTKKDKNFSHRVVNEQTAQSGAVGLG